MRIHWTAAVLGGAAMLLGGMRQVPAQAAPKPATGTISAEVESKGKQRETKPLSGDPDALPVVTPANGGATMPPPPSPPLGRRRIGVALGGGGALALSDIGVLRWFDENHIPVDVIAGTSMGALVGSLYATGHSPQQIAALTTDQVFARVFRLDQDFQQLNFRRREDARFLPGGFNLGLKHGVSFRNGVLLDYGLNEFLNAQFLPYGAAYDFDRLPIPFRCVATDILVGREAVFAHGPLAEAVRASISIPGVFPPLEDGGHIYVDGALAENLPVDVVKRELHADVVLAVSLPLTPPDRGDTNSLLGILQRSFSVASWSNEVRSRAQADLVIEPETPAGAGAADYAKEQVFSDAGYAAAEKQRARLLQYRLSDAEWQSYVAEHRNRVLGPVKNANSVVLIAGKRLTVDGIAPVAAPLLKKPVRPETVEAVQNEIRSDGRYEVDYFLSRPGEKLDFEVTGPANEGRQVPGRELLHPLERRGPSDESAAEQYAQDTATVASASAPAAPGGAVLPPSIQGAKPQKRRSRNPYETVAPSSQEPVVARVLTQAGSVPQPGDADLTLYVHDKPFGPPFLLLGGNVVAQTGGTQRATIDAVVTEQDFGGYGSELRTRVRFGYLTEVRPEYYRRLTGGGAFLAPRIEFYRAPVLIWSNQNRVAERQLVNAGGGVDVGYTLSHRTEVRAGWQELSTRWHTNTGSDGLPDFNDHQQLTRVLYRFNGQDRALIPRHGLRLDAEMGYAYGSPRSQDAPRFQSVLAYFRDIGRGNTLSLSGEGGTYFNRNVADPYRFTLGGPLRLAASAFDEYRGTDYFLIRPAYFRRIASLPAPLGQSIYVVGAFEAGQVRSPNGGTTTQEDVFFGLAAETPFGAITFGPALGTNDHRKINFTLGRFF